MDAYSPTAWGPAFTAIAGGAAALTGLLFVAMSINLSQIIKVPGLVGRAAEVLIILTGVLAVATLLLMPGQSAPTMGFEVLSVGLLAEVLVTAIQVRAFRQRTTLTGFQYLGRVYGGQFGLVLLLVGGVSLLVQDGGGLYWIVPGAVATMIGAIVGAWVLLVEILR